MVCHASQCRLMPWTSRARYDAVRPLVSRPTRPAQQALLVEGGGDAAAAVRQRLDLVPAGGAQPRSAGLPGERPAGHQLGDDPGRDGQLRLVHLGPGADRKRPGVEHVDLRHARRPVGPVLHVDVRREDPRPRGPPPRCCPGTAFVHPRLARVGDQGTNALAALILGSAVAVLLFIPVAAVQYRRDGRLGPGDLSVLVGAAVYGVALWTYTLLPLPDVGDYTCQHAQTRVMAFADDIRRAAEQSGYAGLGTPGELLRNQAFLQVVLNVVLFLPFGVFVRLITHRGVLVATDPRPGRVAADRGHPAHRRVGRVPVRLPPLRRRRPPHQHARRLPRCGRLLPVRRPETPPARHRPPCAADHGLGRPAPRGHLSDVLFVVLAGTAAAALWRGYLVFAEHERPATDSPGDDRAARRRTPAGRGPDGAASRGRPWASWSWTPARSRPRPPGGWSSC